MSLIIESISSIFSGILLMVKGAVTQYLKIGEIGIKGFSSIQAFRQCVLSTESEPDNLWLIRSLRLILVLFESRCKDCFNPISSMIFVLFSLPPLLLRFCCAQSYHCALRNAKKEGGEWFVHDVQCAGGHQWRVFFRGMDGAPGDNRTDDHF